MQTPTLFTSLTRPLPLCTSGEGWPILCTLKNTFVFIYSNKQKETIWFSFLANFHFLVACVCRFQSALHCTESIAICCMHANMSHDCSNAPIWSGGGRLGFWITWTSCSSSLSLGNSNSYRERGRVPVVCVVLEHLTGHTGLQLTTLTQYSQPVTDSSRVPPTQPRPTPWPGIKTKGNFIRFIEAF